MSLFIGSPQGVAPQAARSVTTIFTIGGVFGLGLIAWSIYLRSHKSRGDSWPLWITYVVLLGPLVALAVFVGDELVEMVWERPSPREFRRSVNGIIALLFILLGPICLLFRRKSPTKRPQGDDQQKNTGPGASRPVGDDRGASVNNRSDMPGDWRFRPVGSLVFVAVIAGIYGLAIWVEQYIPGSISVAGLVFGLLIFSVLALRPLRNLVFYPPPPPRLDHVGPNERPQPKAEPDDVDIKT